MFGWFKRGFQKAATFGQALRAGLGGSTPGAWASDHRTEAQKFTGWNYTAIHALGKQCAGCELEVFDKFENPLKEDHRLVRLLRRPNPDQSGRSMRYQIAQQLQLTGTAIIIKWPNKTHEWTSELYVLPTALADPIRPSSEYPKGAWRIGDVARYSYLADDQGFTNVTGLQQLVNKTIRREDTIVIRWPHPLFTDDGQSPVSAGALWADVSDELDSSRFAQFRNGADPSLVIELPEGEDPSEWAKQKFRNSYGGSDKHGEPLWLPNGTKAVPWSTSPHDMDYVQGAEQIRDMLMGIHGTPPVAAGIAEGGSYAAFYASLKQFSILTVQPMLDLIADEINEQLSRPEYDAHMVLTTKSVEDPTLVETQIQNDITAGAITKNELRELRGRPPIEGGDELIGGAAAPMSDGGAEELGDEESTGISALPLPIAKRLNGAGCNGWANYP